MKESDEEELKEVGGNREVGKGGGGGKEGSSKVSFAFAFESDGRESTRTSA